MELVKYAHIVSMVVPQDIDGAAMDGATSATGDRICMKNWGHATIVLFAGTMGDARVVTLKQCTDATNSLSDEKALAFTKMYANVGLTTSSFTETTVTANTFNAATSNNNLYVMEVEGSDLDVDNGFDWIRLDITTDDTAATIVAVLVILTEPKYSAKAGSMPSAIS